MVGIVTTTGFPDFFIPGSPKAGTTSLAGWLAAHPQVAFCEPKEPRFFNSDFALPNRPSSLKDYLDLFPPIRPGVLRGEATTGYLVSRVAVATILETNPDARFIVCLREPAGLFFSLHRQRLKEGYEDMKDPLAAWRASKPRQTSASIPFTCPDRQMLDYERYCALGDQLEFLFGLVPREQVHIVFNTNLANHPQASFDAICDFLTLPRVTISAELTANTAKVPRSLFLAKVLRSLGLVRNRLGMRRGFGIARILGRFNLKEPERQLDSTIRDELRRLTSPQVEKLRHLIGELPEEWT